MGGKQYESKNCLLPCTILSVKSTYLQNFIVANGINKFVLFFTNDVLVERIVLAYGLDDLLVRLAVVSASGSDSLLLGYLIS